MKVYDPRIKQIVESDNPALVFRSLEYGNEPLDEETEARISVMANYCDEPVADPFAETSAETPTALDSSPPDS
jgi:hypothetical protein